jgi:hypothetical protein
MMNKIKSLGNNFRFFLSRNTIDYRRTKGYKNIILITIICYPHPDVHADLLMFCITYQVDMADSRIGPHDTGLLGTESQF